MKASTVKLYLRLKKINLFYGRKTQMSSWDQITAQVPSKLVLQRSDALTCTQLVYTPYRSVGWFHNPSVTSNDWFPNKLDSYGPQLHLKQQTTRQKIHYYRTSSHRAVSRSSTNTTHAVAYAKDYNRTFSLEQFYTVYNCNTQQSLKSSLGTKKAMQSWKPFSYQKSNTVMNMKY